MGRSNSSGRFFQRVISGSRWTDNRFEGPGWSERLGGWVISLSVSGKERNDHWLRSHRVHSNQMHSTPFAALIESPVNEREEVVFVCYILLLILKVHVLYEMCHLSVLHVKAITSLIL